MQRVIVNLITAGCPELAKLAIPLLKNGQNVEATVQPWLEMNLDTKNAENALNGCQKVFIAKVLPAKTACKQRARIACR